MAKDDLISRRAMLAALSSRLSIVDMVGVAEIVESVPAVDAEPVVRCGECKYGDDEGGTALNFRVCKLSKRSELLDWYCPYGKRRKRNGE